MANNKKWWNPSMNQYAQQLSKGVLNEMKKRILNSNIKKQKLELNEDSQRMTEFFQREIERYNKRKSKQNNCNQELGLLKTELDRLKNDLKEKENECEEAKNEFKELVKVTRRQKNIIDSLALQRTSQRNLRRTHA